MSNITIKQNNILSNSSTNAVINPSQMLNSTSDLVTSIYESTLTNSLSKFNVQIEDIKNGLLNQTINIKLNRQRNKEYLNDIVAIAYSLPKLFNYSQTKPVIPEFDEIKV